MAIPDLPIPGFVAKWLSWLPSTPPSWALTALLNHLQMPLGIDSAPLNGHSLLIHVVDIGVKLHFRVENERFNVVDSATIADVTVSAKLADFLRMMLREEDPDTLFFNRRLLIEGDTELGLIVKNILDAIDWEGIRPTFPLFKKRNNPII